ncbi:MAG: hypothetical protein ARM1_0389 [Candidatus Micrarchaeota archaeon]|nr:MAG: hypothetical protein ARM1_0389 [Candidatus Micrarchaeota archaeon]
MKEDEVLNKKAYTKIKFTRFSVALLALITSAAHLYAIPGAYPVVTFYLDIEIAVYVIIAMVFLLGLKMWYLPSILYNIFNLFIFFLSAFIAIPFVNSQPLVGHIEFMQYSFGRLFSLIGWIYITIMGIVLLRYDKGSKLNYLLEQY